MSHKDLLTTGQAAKLARVSQQTIIRCFDDGLIKGFRIPGSKFRKIPRDELYRFMRENDILLPSTKALFFDPKGLISNRLGAEATHLEFVDNEFELGSKIYIHLGAYVILYNQDSHLLPHLVSQGPPGIVVIYSEQPTEVYQDASDKVRYVRESDLIEILHVETGLEYLRRLF